MEKFTTINEPIMKKETKKRKAQAVPAEKGISMKNG